MTAAAKTRRRQPKLDEAPSRAIGVLQEAIGDWATRADGRKLVASLAAAGLQVVESGEFGRAQHEIEALRARVSRAETAAANLAHASERLDQAHADAQAQLALAMHWGAELIGRHKDELGELYMEQAEDLMCGTCGGDGGFNENTTCPGCEGTGLAVDELKVARKTALDLELAAEERRFEYGRLLEAERGRRRAVELELEQLREQVARELKR